MFYVHLAIVCWFATFTLADTGQIAVPSAVQAMFYFRPVEIPLSISWVLAPVWMAFAVGKLSDRSTAFRAGLFIADVLLSAFQFWVMLPLVQ